LSEGGGYAGETETVADKVAEFPRDGPAAAEDDTAAVAAELGVDTDDADAATEAAIEDEKRAKCDRMVDFPTPPAPQMPITLKSD
jgi:hypothetical protein